MATVQNTYTGDGSQTLYSFTFPYIQEDDVRVKLDDVLQDRDTYTFSNASTLQFNTAPGSGVAIVIFRDTQIDDLPNTFYPGSAIRARDLNDNFTQNLYVIQENAFLVDDANDAATSAEAAANAASAAATQAQTDATQAVADASQALTTANTAITDASQASTDAAQAAIDANASSAAATAAQTSATNAENAAVTAAADASSAVTDASTALSTANTAASNASTALSTANTAASNASTALSTANAADTKSDTAITDSANALSTANAASAAVSSVVTYTLVANTAAIPGSPSDGDRIEVVDSTGIESFTPLAGVPVGFVGDSLKSARISYDSVGVTWNWIGYVVIDPDARYAQITGQAFTGTVSAPSFSGPLTGDVTGNTNGTHTGPVNGDVTGNLTGDTNGTHTGSVNGNVTGTATEANALRVSSSGFSSANNRPIACFGTNATPAGSSYSSIRYAETNPPTISGTGNIQAPGGITANLTGNADTATDANTVDGYHASAFLKSGENDTASGNLTFNGTVNIRGALDFTDNVILSLGDSDDFQMFFNGSNTYFDLRNGNLYVRDGTSTRFTFDDAGHFTASGNITATGNISADSLSGTLGNSQVRNAIALGSAGNLGTYAMLKKVTAGSVSNGGIVNGADLRFASAAGNGQDTPTGQWQCMGRALDSGAQDDVEMTTLWLRVS